jgi:hypothetical protein
MWLPDDSMRRETGEEFRLKSCPPPESRVAEDGSHYEAINKFVADRDIKASLLFPDCMGVPF